MDALLKWTFIRKYFAKNVAADDASRDKPRFENEQSTELLPPQKNKTTSDEFYVNYGTSEQMQVIGYVHDSKKSFVVLFLTILTLGFFRLLLHWYPKWHLHFTCKKVPIELAEKLLVIEKYKDKHETFYIKLVKKINVDEINWSEMSWQNVDDDKNDENKCVFNNTATLHDEFGTIAFYIGNGKFRHVEDLKYFTVKKVMYIWIEETREFIKLEGLDSRITGKELHDCEPLTLEEYQARKAIYGQNEIAIPKKSAITLLFLEVLNPYYIFQVGSFILWFLDNYYAYATAILILSAQGIIESVIQSKRNQKKLESKVQNGSFTKVLRRKRANDATVIELNVPTVDLVPGDVIKIESNEIMRCDAVLLKGDCIVNESMLTGESVPVSKNMISRVDAKYDAKEHARHTLFCGTQILQSKSPNKEATLAVVIRTGYSTTKGNLIRSILYPPPVDFRFEKDSYKFIGILAFIALFGFTYTVYAKLKRGLPFRDVMFGALDLITIVVPPALPAAMTTGRLNAEKRLKKQKIFCISPRSINVAGSINCVCFDKTGTLTEDGLDVLCVVPVKYRYFQVRINNIADMVYDDLMFGLAACHSLTMIDDKLIGEPLEVKILESTGWTVEDSTGDNTAIFTRIVRPPAKRRMNQSDGSAFGSKDQLQEMLDTLSKFLPSGENVTEEMQCLTELFVGIVKEFPFMNSLQRMSVLVKRSGSNHFELFCKGSPEMILSLTKPDMIPEDFERVLNDYTAKGYRVIAFGQRKLNMKVYEIMRAEREELERDLEILGLVILENRLKPETTPVIAKLNNANLRTIMITGDNLLTAVSVAKECGIIREVQDVVTVDVSADKDLAIPTLTFSLKMEFQNESRTDCHMMNGKCHVDSLKRDESILSYEIPSASINSMSTIESTVPYANDHVAINIPIDDCFSDKPNKIGETKKAELNYCFVLTGKVWSVLIQHYADLIPRIITRGAVFARMSSEQKQAVVYELQSQGYCVAMVGDGANDVGALRTAHCGISLSDTEASVAAPFTAAIPNITAALHVICHGRGALVTSFSIFKFMAVYSLIQFTSVLILYEIDSNFSDMQFIYIDLLIITAFAYFCGRTEACTDDLCPIRPQSSLISFVPIASLFLQVLFSFLFQLTAFLHLRRQPWYNGDKKYGNDVYPSVQWPVENFVIFIISSFHYISAAVIFSKGRPYRKAMWTNWGLMTSVIVLALSTMYLDLYPSKFFVNWLQLAVPADYYLITNETVLNANITDVIPSLSFLNDSIFFNDTSKIKNDAPFIDNSRWNFQIYLLLYSIVHLLLSMFVEWFLLDYIAQKKILPKFHNVSNSKKKYLRIERELKLISGEWPMLHDDYRGYSPEDLNSIQEQRHRTIIMRTRRFALQESERLDLVLHNANHMDFDWRTWLLCVMDNEDFLRKTANGPIEKPFRYNRAIRKYSRTNRLKAMSMIDESTLDFLRLRPTPPLHYFRMSQSQLQSLKQRFSTNLNRR